MSEFEQYLLENNFKLKFINESCDCDDKYYFYYIQECECCRGKSKVWWKYGPYCEECLISEIGCLQCGGHYKDVRVFKKDVSFEDITSEFF